MNDAPRLFVRRVLVRQLCVGLAAFVVVALFAPRLLVLEDDVVTSVFTVGATLAVLALAASMVVTILSARAHRGLLQALGSGSGPVVPEALRKLAELPSSLTTWTFAVGSLTSALVLVPGIRPDKLDDGRAISLFTLAVTILGGAAIPNYLLSRQATMDVLELSPLEPLTYLLDALELRKIPWTRMSRRLLLAVVAPVALLGAGTVLVTHAHLRTLIEQSKRTTAVQIAGASLDGPYGSTSAAGRVAAAEAAARLGFWSRIEPTAAESSSPSIAREPDGQLVVTAPLDDGQAVIRYSADLDTAAVSRGVGVGLLAVLLAGVLGLAFGRAFAGDLVQATRSLRLLGTEAVIRGAHLSEPARFRVVEDLGRAIDELTRRFQVFATAQERALDARASAQRMRGFLFASVSHDLKSPLNAILGFAELVGREPLTSAQRESLGLIEKRGRELLGLIETILDAARVEAGQLDLSPRPAPVGRLVSEAVKKARELAGDGGTAVVTEVADDLPMIPADPAYATRALAVIVAHAIRTSAQEGSGFLTRVRATMPARPGDRVCVDVEYGSREVTAPDLEQLFARQATGRGRGLTLGLSLARSAIELHGGAVEVEGRREGGCICHVWMPLVSPSERPQISTFPTLG